MNYDLLHGELIRDEGLRLSPYRDSEGYLSIGVGRCLDTNPLTPEEIAYIGHDCRSDSITTDQAMWLLDRGIGNVQRELDIYLPWVRALDEVRQRAFANLWFNLGHRLLGFKHMLVAAVAHDWDLVARELLNSLWRKQVGDRALRLAHMLEIGG